MGTIIHWWWFGVLVWWWRLRNAPEDRAFIFTRQGHYYDLILATRQCITRDGEVYKYGRHIVLVHKNHPFESYEDERILGEADGELVATPFTGTGTVVDETLISNFMEGNASVQLSDSIEAPGRGGGFGFKQLRWILLIVAVMVVGIVVWKFVLHGHLPGATPVVTPTPTSTPTPSGPVFSWLIEWAGYIRGVAGV